jgi:hypothetical protein
MGGSYIASWSRQKKRVVITDPAGSIAASYPVPHDGDLPTPLLLRGTGWFAYPGSEWQEEPPGQWAVAVFSFQHPPTTGATGSDTEGQR